MAQELREAADGGAEATGSAALDFVPVVVVTKEREVVRTSAIEIELSGVRVRVVRG